MAQDTVADALNMIKNAKKARKESVKIKIVSNLLIEVLKIMKQKEAIKRLILKTEVLMFSWGIIYLIVRQ